MENFASLNLPEALNHTLAHMKFDKPTPIQAQAIPYALEGRDILGSAQTGTGKTGAFGIPLVAHLLNNSKGTALIMTPTRELASQVLAQIQAFLGKRSSIKTALLIGGDSMPKQIQMLRNRARVIVGTPGRINDHLERGTLMLHDAGFLVLDETDRMLDMGFTDQIEKIMKFMPKKRQTLLFSATIPKNIAGIAGKYLNNPERVSVSARSAPAANLKQTNVTMAEGEKFKHLTAELDAREGSIIVFVKTKHGADRMAKKLRAINYQAEAIHGDLRQNKRDKVIREFRAKKHRILVATDVAARGLDIPHIEHVINHDLPQVAEDYIHRIGRTARAGAEGEAISFITPADRLKWRAIEKLLDPNAKQEPMREFKPKKSSFKKSRSRSGGGDRNASKHRRDGDNRSEGRSDNRGEKRNDNRGEKRSENRNENRSEKRNDARGEKRSDNRGEKRNDTRNENRAPRGDGSHKPKRPTGGRPAGGRPAGKPKTSGKPNGKPAFRKRSSGDRTSSQSNDRKAA